MPATSPFTADQTNERLLALGQEIRLRRKTLGVNATVAAQAAGISRVTLHRIEKGEPSVTMGAYLNVLAALGMSVSLANLPRADDKGSGEQGLASRQAETIPVRIEVADYPQLAKLAWQVHGVSALTPIEAWDIYERNWRHMDHAMLSDHERSLIDGLERALGKHANV